MNEAIKYLVKQTNASLLAETYTHTQVSNSEIRPENFIPCSPDYVPFK